MKKFAFVLFIITTVAVGAFYHLLIINLKSRRKFNFSYYEKLYWLFKVENCSFAEGKSV